ncbi:aminoacyl-tRNA deacylase [Marinisporobacter balticus]|uniref:Prolyl-tRNA editing enzyme YbaK/EbsC (Cys-tRNA(Pro) deacylase) n=1 Tax=Marinisporobacter balticus TaxID=2018667 RepID=A0A4R2KCE4_9FIRM|nr:YbaK/EbsC family protein [Marinisporobacter balticus]TCO67886.1 prolyl-tRNA editing enzyme YbaK/EbsC (Cys-tRNA(Pro) deacylase) [Marinisporobacter balticus]
MDRLVTNLNKYNIEYEIINHSKKINTAQEGADYFGINIGQTAPTLILKTENGYYALIISGDYGRINFEIIKEMLKVQQVKLAKPTEVEQVTGYKIGSIPLINHGLPVIMDRQLNRFTYVYGGTGISHATLKISPNDIAKLNNVVSYIR